MMSVYIVYHIKLRGKQLRCSTPEIVWTFNPYICIVDPLNVGGVNKLTKSLTLDSCADRFCLIKAETKLG